MTDPLFEPIEIRGLEVRNRIYLPAMHLNMASDFEVTDQLVAFYTERARGGAGLISVGFATVDERSGLAMNIGAHKDEHIPGLKRLADAMKAHGARTAVQLNHGGRYMHSFLIAGQEPVAPSPLPSRLTRETPRALDPEGIAAIIEAFAQAARRVQEAGFDAVEVLHGTGYLISEFLSPLTNQREDGYGGPLENRMRFGREVMQAIRKQVGPGYPLIVRMNGNDFMPGGQGRGELITYARALAADGVDALCINVGWHEARVPQIVTGVPRGAFAYLARGFKEATSVPIIASHRINDPQTARELLLDGMCDLVAIGRALIADPEWPRKAREGREDEIVHCIACAQGCFDHLFELRQVECLCNPRAGHEADAPPAKAAPPKRVMVVGGGPAGMSAALGARERGHLVTLYERSDRLGGQLLLAGSPPGRAEFKALARDLARQVALKDIRVELQREVDAALIEQERPDAVIVASGAEPLVPSIPGVDLPLVVQSWDVLLYRVATGRRVVVIGGGAVGVETALFLAEKGTLPAEVVKFLLVQQAEPPEVIAALASKGSKEVVLVEMVDRVGQDIGKTTRWTMLQDLERLGVTVRTGARATEISADGVTLELNGEAETIAADSVVLAMGARPYNPLQDALAGLGIPFSVVGDAGTVATAFDAIHQGWAAGLKIA